MRAEVISIGDELTSGQRLDTNSQWLSIRLEELGVKVVAHATVADDMAANVEIFRQAVDRADVVIATGGLGPTADDLTREALAQVSGQPLVLDEAALAHIRGLFTRRGREMPERNVMQAMFPTGSQAIPNPEGTAPGIAIDVARSDGGVSHLFALPGVPAEMREMWTASVVPALVSLGAGQQVIRHRRIKCFGTGESALEAMLPDIIRRGRDPLVGITVHEATITLRITAEGASDAECAAKIEPTVETIRQSLGPLVFGEEDDELQDAVVRLLTERGQTLATCEWGTGGLVAEWLSETSSSDGPYLGGLVLRSAASARAALGCELPEGNPHAMVEALALACRERFASNYALAIGPFPAAATDTAQGHMHIALASPSGVRFEKTRFGAHPAILRPLTAKRALDALRLILIQQD
jgi:nicotinamide-nucleotide amidase